MATAQEVVAVPCQALRGGAVRNLPAPLSYTSPLGKNYNFWLNLSHLPCLSLQHRTPQTVVSVSAPGQLAHSPRTVEMRGCTLRL